MDIKRLCSLHGIGVKQLAAILNISDDAIYRMKRQECCSMETLIRMSKLFGMDPFDIVHDIYYDGPYKNVPLADIIKKAISVCGKEEGKKLLSQYYTYHPIERSYALHRFYELYDIYATTKYQQSKLNASIPLEKGSYSLHVKEIRTLKNISKAKLAELSGLSIYTISKVEKGGTCNSDSLCKIAEALEVSPYDLLAYHSSYDRVVCLKENIETLYHSEDKFIDTIIRDLESYYTGNREMRADWLQIVANGLRTRKEE